MRSHYRQLRVLPLLFIALVFAGCPAPCLRLRWQPRSTLRARAGIVLPPIPAWNQPQGVAVNPVTNKIYVVNRAATT